MKYLPLLLIAVSVIACKEKKCDCPVKINNQDSVNRITDALAGQPKAVMYTDFYYDDDRRLYYAAVLVYKGIHDRRGSVTILDPDKQPQLYLFQRGHTNVDTVKVWLAEQTLIGDSIKNHFNNRIVNKIKAMIE